MITLRHKEERGHANHGWLNTYHTFSFASYHDPEHTGFRSLRVINEDRVAPGHGFGTHPHRDMEILTYVLDGALEHKDSMGHVSVLSAGEVQRITAGRGITHSEYNASQTEPVHFYQIWLLPEDKGLTPGYDQTKVAENSSSPLNLIASRDEQDGAVKINQDVNVYIGRLNTGESVDFSLNQGRHGWIQVTQGEISLNGVALSASDGVAISNENQLEIQSSKQSEFLLFDLS